MTKQEIMKTALRQEERIKAIEDSLDTCCKKERFRQQVDGSVYDDNPRLQLWVVIRRWEEEETSYTNFYATHS